MTTASIPPCRVPRAPWLLLACTLLFALGGCMLLEAAPGRPAEDGQSPAAAASGPQARQTPRTARRPAEITRGEEPARSSAPGPAVREPRRSGRATDREIQQQLQSAWPADLPAAQEQQLRHQAAALLQADATGVGRARFPRLFGARPTGAVAPAFSRLRIQAAIARRDGAADRAVVHLVWAAADRGGTFTDGRTSRYAFHRSKGAGTWMPRT
ncbi:hypothetical protein AB0H82_10700 [Streptomyces sp. NPDC050732]|uniref:hypothetical protein n=1 Tax=Streptomyces sp. NPDC050732 TaxID=3154632 RepID=UPI00341BF5AE